MKDSRTRQQITSRIDRMAFGNFGDTKSVGGGVSELRIHAGPGYRVYYTRKGEKIYLLLCAGTKRTQKKDIKKAIDLAKE